MELVEIENERSADWKRHRLDLTRVEVARACNHLALFALRPWNQNNSIEAE